MPTTHRSGGSPRYLHSATSAGALSRRTKVRIGPPPSGLERLKQIGSTAFAALGCVMATALAALLLMAVGGRSGSLRSMVTRISAASVLPSLRRSSASVGTGVGVSVIAGSSSVGAAASTAAPLPRGCTPQPVAYRANSVPGFEGRRMWGDPLLTSGKIAASSDDVLRAAWVFAVFNENSGSALDVREATWLAAVSSIRNHSKRVDRDIVVLSAGTMSRAAVQACVALRVTVKDVTADLATLCSEIDCDFERPGVPAMGNWKGMWLRLYAWTLLEYERVVYLDNDIVMLKDADDLFAFPEVAAVPDLVFQFSSRFMGYENIFNSGMMVFTPSMDTFRKLKQYVGPYRAALLAANSHRTRWDLPLHLLADQGMLNSYFATCWNVLPAKYMVFSKTFNPGASARDHRVMAQLRGGFNDVRMLHFSNDHAPSDVFSDYRPNPSHSGYDGGCLRRHQRSSCYEWQAAYDEMREKAGLTPAIRAYVAP